MARTEIAGTEIARTVFVWDHVSMGLTLLGPSFFETEIAGLSLQGQNGRTEMAGQKSCNHLSESVHFNFEFEFKLVTTLISTDSTFSL